MRKETPAGVTAANHGSRYNRWPSNHNSCFNRLPSDASDGFMFVARLFFCRLPLTHQRRFSSIFQLRFNALLVLVPGNLSRTCTEAGWSDVYPAVVVACWSDDIDEPSEVSSNLR